MGISIITPTCRPYCLQNLLQNFKRQKYNEKELIIIINNDNISKEEYEIYCKADQRIRVYQLDEATSLAECLNFGIEKARFEYIARFDDDDYYGPLYLQEVDLTFWQNQCSVVNKGSIYCFFKGANLLIQRYVCKEGKKGCLAGGAVLCIKKEVFKEVQFETMPWGEDTAFLNNCIQRGYLICSSSRKNFLAIREEDVHRHTFQVEMDKYLQMNDIKIIARNTTLEVAYKIVDMRQY